jgi:hypothetical protein
VYDKPLGVGHLEEYCTHWWEVFEGCIRGL